ncbi:hypothetical protein G6011_02329 [Alternaria panax]|uniref:Glucose-methanol-choline oxidoreductase N-terminal domain-containing protein n=1 Tax=Alternaria panax TaxID=48097 RepID=A0AAD4FEY5_9PLEO|nr:hypothetical protein G6011_02329 [Alternaria panax]
MLLLTIFTLSYSIIVHAHSHLGRTAKAIDARQVSNKTTYDFVIAGGGIARLTVADRLMESSNITVLVIEYGPFDQGEDGVMVPGAYFPVLYLWLLLISTPQTAPKADAARPNYDILPNTAVSRVILENLTTAGVEYIGTSNGTKCTVQASKEVILAAGSVHTPQILQLSGIGDPADLTSFGIKPISELPGVGRNQQDVLVLKVNYNYTSNQLPNGELLQSNTTYAMEQRILYDEEKPSAYDLAGTTGNLIIQLPLSNWTNASVPIISQAASVYPAAILRKDVDPSIIAGYKKQRAIINKDINKEAVCGFSWNNGPETSIYMTRPFSHSSIKINSTNILDTPLVDYVAITDPTDLDMLYAIYMKNQELMATSDLANLNPIETAPAPGIDNEENIKDNIKAVLQPSNAHQCCTAAMMAREDGGAVDPQNRVYGALRLSVVDASTWPLVAGGGPQVSVYAGAEKI